MNFFLDPLRNFLQDELLYRVVLIVITIVLSFLISKMLGFILKRIVKPFVAKTETELDDKLLAIIGSGIYKIAFPWWNFSFSGNI